MEKILITGITGFVGSHFADYLSKNEKFKKYIQNRYHLSRLDNIKHLIKKMRLSFQIVI